jgi:hypothetical protein
VSQINADFTDSYGHLLNKKPSAVVDKSSGQICLIYETIYIDARLYDEMQAFLRRAFRPYEPASGKKRPWQFWLR